MKNNLLILSAFSIIFIVLLFNETLSYNNEPKKSDKENSISKIDTIKFKHFAFSVTEPKAWIFERQFNRDFGVQAIYFLKRTDYDFRKGFMRLDCYIKDSSNVKNPQKFIDSIKNLFFIDKVDIPLIDTSIIFNSDSKRAAIYNVRGIDCDSYQALAYFEEKDYFVVLQFMLPSRTELEKYYPDFKEIINSYHFISDTIPDYNEKYINSLNKNPGNPEYLENAYKNDSDSLLNAFFDFWSNKESPITDTIIDKKIPLEKAVYDIYKIFYTPKNLKRIVSGKRDDSLYTNVKYIMIQNSINLEILDYNHLFSIENEHTINRLNDFEERNAITKLKILDFKPDVQIEHSKNIYLSDYLSEMINRYLKNQFTPFGQPNIMNTSQAGGQSEIRLEFLNRILKVIPGHWGGYWHIETHPEVSVIIFNKQITEAIINFRLIYQGGQANFILENGKWKMLDSKLTWIE